MSVCSNRKPLRIEGARPSEMGFTHSLGSDPGLPSSVTGSPATLKLRRSNVVVSAQETSPAWQVSAQTQICIGKRFQMVEESCPTDFKEA